MKYEVWPLLDINTSTTSELAPAWIEINYFSWNFLTDWEPQSYWLSPVLVMVMMAQYRVWGSV